MLLRILFLEPVEQLVRQRPERLLHVALIRFLMVLKPRLFIIESKLPEKIRDLSTEALKHAYPFCDARKDRYPSRISDAATASTVFFRFFP